MKKQRPHLKHMIVLSVSGIKRRLKSEFIREIPVSNLPKLEIRKGMLIQRTNSNIIYLVSSTIRRL